MTLSFLGTVTGQATLLLLPSAAAVMEAFPIYSGQYFSVPMDKSMDMRGVLSGARFSELFMKNRKI